MSTALALIDGNSFYCSCERVFARPNAAVDQHPVLCRHRPDQDAGQAGQQGGQETAGRRARSRRRAVAARGDGRAHHPRAKRAFGDRVRGVTTAAQGMCRYSLIRRARHAQEPDGTGRRRLCRPAWQKLRRHGLATDHVTVFMHTSPFADDPQRGVSMTVDIPEATNDSLALRRRGGPSTRSGSPASATQRLISSPKIWCRRQSGKWRCSTTSTMSVPRG
jgi:nucleotidyltransferase/DNA polymerase involved in DNA repair